MKRRFPIFVARDGDLFSVGRNLRFENVPRNVRSQYRCRVRGDVDLRQPPKLRVTIGDGIDALPVSAEDGVSVRDRRIRLRRELRLLSGADIDEPDVTLVDRDLLLDQDRRVVG
jgi:hypothetical protein